MRLYWKLAREVGWKETILRVFRAMIFYLITVVLGWTVVLKYIRGDRGDVMCVLIFLYLGIDIVIGIHRINEDAKYKHTHLPMLDPIPIIIKLIATSYKFLKFVLFANVPADYYDYGDL